MGVRPLKSFLSGVGADPSRAGQASEPRAPRPDGPERSEGGSKRPALFPIAFQGSKEPPRSLYTPGGRNRCTGADVAGGTLGRNRLELACDRRARARALAAPLNQPELRRARDRPIPHPARTMLDVQVISLVDHDDARSTKPACDRGTARNRHYQVDREPELMLRSWGSAHPQVVGSGSPP